VVKEVSVSLCQQDLANDNMPEFYQIYLKSQLEPCQYLLLSILIDLLQSIKMVKLEALAAEKAIADKV